VLFPSQAEGLLADPHLVSTCALLLLPHPSDAFCLVYILISFTAAAGCFQKVVALSPCSSEAIASHSKGEKRNMAGEYLETPFQQSLLGHAACTGHLPSWLWFCCVI